MQFKTGDLAYLKSTGEKVVVIGTDGRGNVIVRRPVSTKECGLQHVENTFFEFELESFDDQLIREFADIEKVELYRAKVVAEAKAANRAVPGLPVVN